MGAEEEREDAAARCTTCGAPLGEGHEGPLCASCAAGPPLPLDPVERTLAAAAAARPRGFGAPAKLLACGACGATLVFDPEAPSNRCPLCGAGSLSASEEAFCAPDRVAPFTVPPAEATAILRRWLKSRIFGPAGFRRLALARGIRGVYVPLWALDATVRTTWTAETGAAPAAEGPRALPESAAAKGGEAPKPAATSRLRWTPAQGEREDRDQETLPATHLPAEALAAIGPFDTESLVSWAPEFLGGWAAETPAFGPDEAWRRIRDDVIDRAHERAAADLPGEHHRSLRVESEVAAVEAASALVPIYVAAVPWGGKVRRLLVNGQTGQAEGELPVSPGKVAAAIAAAVVAVAAMGAVLVHEPPPEPPAAKTKVAPAKTRLGPGSPFRLKRPTPER